MARIIDLKFVNLRVVDGFSDAGAVNNGAGYPAGTTTMLFDGAAGTIPALAQFKVVGSNLIHVITSTDGSTTMTFTPGLTGAVLDDAVITFGGRSVDIKVGDGTLSYTENRELEYQLDRGNLDTVRELDQVPVDVSIDLVWEFITASSGATPTIEDALKNRGEASGWTTSDTANPCSPYAVDIQLEDVPQCTGEDIELITIPNFRWESIEHDADAGTLATTGRANVVEATVIRTSNS